MIHITPKFKEGYQLLHNGILTLSKIEQNGVRIDIPYCKRQQKHLDRKIARVERQLSEDEIIKEWKKVYGGKFNIDSGHQLGDMLFNHMGITPTKWTTDEKTTPSVDKEALEALDVPIVQKMLYMRKLKKGRDTYLANLIRETVDGYLHPFFSLHNVKSYRSASQSPNFQNLPNRDPEIMKMIRQAFIPRDGHMFGGIDYGSMEVRIAACYHKDPNMITYIQDPTTDMHRDVAMDCYKIASPDQVNKLTRYCGKNKFTFAQFYGDYYVNCAKNLYAAISQMELTLTDETPMLDHLSSVGITDYKKFEKHIQQVEDKFWNERFKVYTSWKESWKKKYDKKGYFDLYTGFRCSGYMRKNDILNYPIQGSAFHCLLWALIKLQKWLTDNKMRTLIVGQIHDEIVLDMHLEERDDVLAMCHKIMTRDIVKHWPWIIIPLEVEADFCQVGETWFDKDGIDFPEPIV